MLEVSKLNQFYGESHTLWDVDFSLPQGGCVCVMGRNGVGKTTFLKTIMGLLPVKSGDIRLAGDKIDGRAASSRARLGIGYVPQGREIFPQLTVEENLRVALSAAKKKTVPERVYELFPVLKQMHKRRGGDLSGGQQQQLAIGRALVLEPRLLILDEPTEGIQPNIVHEIGEIIRKLNQVEGLSVLLVEQKLKFARQFARQFCIMDRGRFVAKGEMQQLDENLIKTYLTV